MPFEPSLVPQHPVWEVFHESTRWNPWDWDEVARRARIRRAPAGTDVWEFRRRPLLRLPDPLPATGLAAPLGRTLLSRRSAREFAGAALEWEQISAVLWATSGCLPPDPASQHRRRAIPSAGARYPLETFLWMPVPPSETGVGPYHYEPESHGLREMLADRSPPLEALLAACSYPALVRQAGLLVVLAGVFGRTTAAYGGRGYRFVLIEAGHAVQNTYLACAALGLGAVALGGWNDPMLDSFLGLDGRTAGTVYAVAVGHVPAQGESQVPGGAGRPFEPGA